MKIVNREVTQFRIPFLRWRLKPSFDGTVHDIHPEMTSENLVKTCDFVPSLKNVKPSLEKSKFRLILIVTNSSRVFEFGKLICKFQRTFLKMILLARRYDLIT